MKQKKINEDLLKKIFELERRVSDLERRQPLVITVPSPYSWPSPSIPTYPWYLPVTTTDGTKV